MPRQSPCGNSAALAQPTALVRRPYRSLLQSYASPGIDLVIECCVLVSTSDKASRKRTRPLRYRAQATTKADAEATRWQARRALPGRQSRPGSAVTGLAQPAVIGLTDPIIDLFA